MRLIVGIDTEGREFVGLKTPGGIATTEYRDMLAIIEGGENVREHLREVGETPDRLIAPQRLLPPLSAPTKLLFCGVNFPGHAKENPQAVLPREPFFFAKLPSAIVGPGDPIVIPTSETQTDYEVELAAVIGKTARHVEASSALDHVFGYTLVNDVSARDVQFRDHQITLGKNADTFCPLGPEIVTGDELGDPSHLVISSTVNGELRQQANTSEMLFDVATLISFLSSTMTLYAGDVVTAGTPEGVGCFRDPPVYLQPGDVVTVECDQIGQLTNPVVAGW